MNEFGFADVPVPRPPQYHSYLLRFWEERGETETEQVWRFMIQDPQTQERLGFANLDTLVIWIQQKITPRAEASAAQE